MNKETLRKSEYLKKFPWRKTYWNIRQRCNNKNDKDFKYYGGKGVKALLTAEECAYMWNRDCAFNMIHPSIDRIKSCGHYELNNCHFIERKDNALKARLIVPADEKGK